MQLQIQPVRAFTGFLLISVISIACAFASVHKLQVPNQGHGRGGLIVQRLSRVRISSQGSHNETIPIVRSPAAPGSNRRDKSIKGKWNSSKAFQSPQIWLGIICCFISESNNSRQKQNQVQEEPKVETSGELMDHIQDEIDMNSKDERGNQDVDRIGLADPQVHLPFKT